MNVKLIAAALAGVIISTQAYADQNGQTQAYSMTNQQHKTAEKNKHAGERFLQINKMKRDVITLPDGLQYRVIRTGKGPKPKVTDTVTVEYTGTLIDGTEFDSSSKHGGPADFVLGQVIPGWVEALQLMPIGSTWEIYVPSHLAYGEQGAPPAIGPNETLVFKVRLLNFKQNT